jgi:hypothetical protein
LKLQLNNIIQASAIGSFASASSLLVCTYFDVKFDSCFGTIKKFSSPLVSVNFDVMEAARRLNACKLQTTKEDYQTTEKTKQKSK